VQGWSRAKKEALIKGETNLLNELSKCQNETHFRNYKRKDGVSSSLNAQRSICYINSVNYKKSNGLLIFDLETSVTCV